MNKLKRITATLLALLTVGAFTAFAGCKKETNRPTPPPADTDAGYGFFANELAPATGECATKGHDFGDTGVCQRCESKAFLPAVAHNQKFPTVEICTHTATNCPCPYLGSGKDGYNCLDLEEGCFTVEIGENGVLWISFPVKAAGQYVLHSVGGRDNGVKVTRHAANASYVNEKGIDAVVKEGDFYAFDNCGEMYFNESWRSTYCLKGAKGTLVKIRFIRIADPAWEPKTVRTKVYAQELNEKAQDMPTDKVLIDVPYDSDYFYDETEKCYRMGTKTTPGAIIYAAISKPSPRLFGKDESGNDATTSFTNILKTSGTALHLGNGYTESGDFSVLNYTPFFMNWKDEDATWGSRPGSESAEPEGDSTKKCYQNYCNGDGVYPVNKELYQFLTLYTKQNKPADEALTDVWGTAEDDFSWFSACYYYEQRAVGTEENPKLIEANQNTEITTKRNYFYKINGTGTYTVSCTTDGISIKIAGHTVQNLTEVTVSGADVFEIYFGNAPLTISNITITVTEVTE